MTWDPGHGIAACGHLVVWGDHRAALADLDAHCVGDDLEGGRLEAVQISKCNRLLAGFNRYCDLPGYVPYEFCLISEYWGRSYIRRAVIYPVLSIYHSVRSEQNPYWTHPRCWISHWWFVSMGPAYCSQKCCWNPALGAKWMLVLQYFLCCAHLHEVWSLHW